MDPVTMALVGGGVGAAAGFLGGSKGKKAQFNPYGALNPEQISMVKAMGPELTSAATAGPQYYGGEMTAEMTPEEAAYYNPTRAGLMGGTIDTMMQEANDPAAFSNMFQESVADPSYRLFERNVLPGIGEDYAGFSTARAQAMANARTDLGDKLLMQRYQALQDTKNRALNAYNAVPTVQNYLAAPRIFQQAGLDRKYNDYIQGNQTKQANIDNALRFLGISTGTYTPEQKDTRFSGALSGALMGGVMGAYGGNLLGGGSAVGNTTSASLYGSNPYGAGSGFGMTAPAGVSRTQFINGVPYTF